MNFLQLIQKAKAQGADTLSAPTFPFNPPGQPVASPTQNAPQIRLETDTVNVKTGDEIRVRVLIDTKGERITSYTVNIVYDPAFLRVIDADEVTGGVQINFLDETFAESLNQVNSSTGIINLRANTTEASTVTRTVAEVEFMVIGTGTTEIEIVQSNSNLVNISGVDVLESTNTINLQIEAKTQQVVTPTTPIIPSTSLKDHFGVAFTTLGAMLLVAGLYLIKIIRENNHKD